MGAKRKRKRRLSPIRRRTRPGAPPGTVRPDPSSPKPVLRGMAFGPDRCLERLIEKLEDIDGVVGQEPVVWINVDGLGDGALIEAIGARLGVHALALEDVVNVHQRPKVEDYADGLFIVARMPWVDGSSATEQVSLYLTRSFVVTFQEQPGDCLDPVRDRIRKGRGRIRVAGPDYLAYAILDAIVDAYFPLLEKLGERLERLETSAVEARDPAVPRRLLEVRSELLGLQRTTWSLRETLVWLQREDNPFIAKETRVYLRDCVDHTVQLIEVMESYRELSTSLMEVYMSSVSNRMNEVMKVLTIIATLFIPLTFISSIYGMNFAPEASPWNMPELRWAYGYPFALGLMAVTALVLIAYFRRKHWL